MLINIYFAKRLSLTVREIPESFFLQWIYVSVKRDFRFERTYRYKFINIVQVKARNAFYMSLLNQHGKSNVRFVRENVSQCNFFFQ